ncbi:MAG: hypothetical protein JJU07_06125, partial [Natronohydrobacter sp.]|nr:hypothetical protein [Natronohydrobacter sp.]
NHVLKPLSRRVYFSDLLMGAARERALHGCPAVGGRSREIAAVAAYDKGALKGGAASAQRDKGRHPAMAGADTGYGGWAGFLTPFQMADPGAASAGAGAFYGSDHKIGGQTLARHTLFVRRTRHILRPGQGIRQMSQAPYAGR